MSEIPTEKRHSSLGAHITTAIIASCAAFSASLLYFHFFPQVKETPAPIAVVDMVKLAAAITEMNTQGDAKAFMNSGHAIAMLKANGYVVLDSRMVIAAPDEYVMTPSELVAGASDNPSLGGYVPPNLTEGMPTQGVSNASAKQ